MITFNGKTQSLGKWAKELGMSESTLKTRIYRLGWSVEDALISKVNPYTVNSGEKKEEYREIFFENKMQSLRKWSEELEISESTLRFRLGKLGWSIEKAFTTPTR